MEFISSCAYYIAGNVRRAKVGINAVLNSSFAQKVHSVSINEIETLNTRVSMEASAFWTNVLTPAHDVRIRRLLPFFVLGEFGLIQQTVAYPKFRSGKVSLNLIMIINPDEDVAANIRKSTIKWK